MTNWLSEVLVVHGELVKPGSNLQWFCSSATTQLTEL